MKSAYQATDKWVKWKKYLQNRMINKYAEYKK